MSPQRLTETKRRATDAPQGSFLEISGLKGDPQDENTQQLRTSVQASALPSSKMKRLINTGKLASSLWVDASHSGSLSPTGGFSSSLVQFGSSALEPPQPPLANLLSYTLFSKTVRGRGFSLVARSYDAEWNEQVDAAVINDSSRRPPSPLSFRLFRIAAWICSSSVSPPV